MDDERALVRAAQRGSAEAVGELFRRHWTGVWRAAYAVLGRRERADDVAQEAFLRALRALDRFDAGRPLAPWLVRIAVNAARDELRRERRLGQLDEAAFAGLEGIYEDADDEIVRAVGALPADRRLILVLHYWLDLATPEIAELLDLPLGTVASRLSRALGELRTDLEAEHV
jgi:RNA polymerase sigma-70 factor (ECF subfamily)